MSGARAASHVEFCQMNELPLIHRNNIYMLGYHVLVTEHGFISLVKVFQFDLFTHPILIGLNENRLKIISLHWITMEKYINMSIAFSIQSPFQRSMHIFRMKKKKEEKSMKTEEFRYETTVVNNIHDIKPIHWKTICICVAS